MNLKDVQNIQIIIKCHQKNKQQICKICVVIINQGGGVAAPIGAQIFGEVLPYLETIKDGETGEEEKREVEVPNIEGKTIKEATSILKENNLQIVISNEQEGMEEERSHAP